MTRAERLAAQAAQARKELEATHRRLAQVEAAQREEARKELRRRQGMVGKLAHEAGLLAWDDTTLAALFEGLAQLRDVPNPVAVLEGLLTAQPQEVG